MTLNAGTYTLGAIANFNPQTTQTFTGSMYIFDTNGTQLSNVVSAAPVPEPAAVGLAAAAGLGLVRLARRRLGRAAALSRDA